MKTKKSSLIAIRLKIEKFVKEQLWIHIIVVSFVAFFAWLFDKPFEAVMFLVAHFVIRPKFDKQYHSKFNSVCMVITISVAFFGILFCFPIKVSLLSSIPLAFFVCWVGDVLQTKIELKLENSKLKEQVNDLEDRLKWFLKPKIFNVKTCTEQELIARCQELHFSKEDQDLAIAFFIEKAKHSYLADMMNIEEKSVTMRKLRMKQRLNKEKSTEENINQDQQEQ